MHADWIELARLFGARKVKFLAAGGMAAGVTAKDFEEDNFFIFGPITRIIKKALSKDDVAGAQPTMNVPSRKSAKKKS